MDCHCNGLLENTVADYEVASEAVKQTWQALKFVDASTPKRTDLVLLAAKQNWRAVAELFEDSPTSRAELNLEELDLEA